MSLAAFGEPTGFTYPMGTTPPTLKIEVGGITFTGHAPAGAGYGLTGWDGWINGSDGRGGPLPWDTADGGYEGSVAMGGRTITLEGVVVARSLDELWAMCDQLGKLCVGNRWETMTVTERSIDKTRTMRVSRLRKPQITMREERRTAVFTLEFQSARFEKLGITQQSTVAYPGTTFTAKNIGDYPAQFTANFVGPLTNAYLNWHDENGTARQWSLKQTINSGQTISVDFAQRKVRDLATAAHYRLNASGVWPVLLPGETKYTLAGNGGTGYAEFFWRSAWM